MQGSNPWGDANFMQMIHSFVVGLQHIGLKELGLIFAILVMDAALSGDNSIAINALAMDVPEKLRSRVIYLGLGLAAILRVVALAFAAFIATNPWVQVLGAFYLFYLVYGHFSKDDEEDSGAKRAPSSVASVLFSIGLLDLSLSTDNIIAVVSMSQNIAVIVIGVVASILMLAVAAQVVRKVMAHYPSLEGAAYIILAFLGAMMLAEHGAETVAWLAAKGGLGWEWMRAYTYHIGDVGEIIGVAAIIATAIMREEVYLRPRRSKSKDSAKQPANVTPSSLKARPLQAGRLDAVVSKTKSKDTVKISSPRVISRSHLPASDAPDVNLGVDVDVDTGSDSGVKSAAVDVHKHEPSHTLSPSSHPHHAHTPSVSHTSHGHTHTPSHSHTSHDSGHSHSHTSYDSGHSHTPSFDHSSHSQ